MKSESFSGVDIHYFTGTGNARSVSGWFMEEARKQGLDGKIIYIGNNDADIPSPEEDQLIGICSPTHGFNFPPVVIKYLFRFPKGRNRVFIINTRAGMKLWKIPLVGLSGPAQLFSALILRCKGYRIVGMKPIDLPSNWLSLHPGLREKVIVSLFDRCEKQTREFAGRILSGKRGYRALLDLVQDILAIPLAIAYYFIGRFVLAKSFVASSNCTMCGKCVRNCPVKAIKVIDNRPFWTFKCESCMKCMNECPERAIQTAHGLVIGSLYLLMTVGMEMLYLGLYRWIPEDTIPGFLHNGFVEFVIVSALCIPFLWLSYRIVHLLMRFRFFERMVVLTSLTFYKWWRRYRGIKTI